MKYFVAKSSDNWSDEMDIEGFTVLSESKKKTIVTTLENYKESLELCIGTNEFIEYEDGKTFLDRVSFTEITEEQAIFTSNMFGQFEDTTDKEAVENYLWACEMFYDPGIKEEYITNKVKNLPEPEFNELLVKARKYEIDVRIYEDLNPGFSFNENQKKMDEWILSLEKGIYERLVSKYKNRVGCSYGFDLLSLAYDYCLERGL